MIQRRLRVGYTRAGRLIDMLERRGVISGYEGSKPRQVLIGPADVPRILAGNGGSAEGPPTEGAGLETVSSHHSRCGGSRFPASVPRNTGRPMNSRYDQQPGPGIGATLKDARRRLGMDIKEAEKRTKIRTRVHPRVLEAEDWEVLPAPAYVRGFLRTYGQILGLDGEALADRYRRAFEEPAAAAATPPEPVLRNRKVQGSRPPSRGGWIVAIGAGVLVLVVILAVIGLTSGGDEGGGGKDRSVGKSKSKDAKQVAKPDKTDREPIDISVEPLATTRICLVGGGDALVDSQVLAVGAVEQFSGEKRYRLDLVGGGVVKLKAGGDEEKLEAGGMLATKRTRRGSGRSTTPDPIARERQGGNSRHRHRGADRSCDRPQRSLGLRATR